MPGGRRTYAKAAEIRQNRDPIQSMPIGFADRLRRSKVETTMSKILLVEDNDTKPIDFKRLLGNIDDFLGPR